MYFEQEIINGVLCHRGTPDGDWIPYTSTELTKMLVCYHSARSKMFNILDMASNYDYLKSTANNLVVYLRSLVY